MMTKEEFEKKVLYGKTMEEYEERWVYDDLFIFRDVRLATTILLRAMQEQNDRIVFGKRIMRLNMSDVGELLDMMYDPQKQFEIFEEGNVSKLKLLGIELGLKEDRWLAKLDSLKRLYFYRRVKGMTISETLSLFTERDYVLDVKENDPERYRLWHEHHPGEAEDI